MQTVRATSHERFRARIEAGRLYSFRAQTDATRKSMSRVPDSELVHIPGGVAADHHARRRARPGACDCTPHDSQHSAGSRCSQSRSAELRGESRGPDRGRSSRCHRVPDHRSRQQLLASYLAVLAIPWIIAASVGEHEWPLWHAAHGCIGSNAVL